MQKISKRGLKKGRAWRAKFLLLLTLYVPQVKQAIGSIATPDRESLPWAFSNYHGCIIIKSCCLLWAKAACSLFLWSPLQCLELHSFVEWQHLPFLFPLQIVGPWSCSRRYLCRTLFSEHWAPQTLHIRVWLPVDKLILQLMVSLVLMKPISLFLKLMGVLKLIDISFWNSQTKQSQGILGSIAVKGLMDRKF